jgi:hypothetical protein
MHGADGSGMVTDVTREATAPGTVDVVSIVNVVVQLHQVFLDQL